MKGKTLIEKKVGNKFWSADMKTKNARGKKRSQQKAEAERATRTIRRQSKFEELGTRIARFITDMGRLETRY